MIPRLWRAFLAGCRGFRDGWVGSWVRPAGESYEVRYGYPGHDLVRVKCNDRESYKRMLLLKRGIKGTRGEGWVNGVQRDAWRS